MVCTVSTHLYLFPWISLCSDSLLQMVTAPLSSPLKHWRRQNAAPTNATIASSHFTSCEDSHEGASLFPKGEKGKCLSDTGGAVAGRGLWQLSSPSPPRCWPGCLGSLGYADPDPPHLFSLAGFKAWRRASLEANVVLKDVQVMLGLCTNRSL